MTSHIRLLKRNGYEIDSNSLTSDPKRLLESLRDRKDKRLKAKYKMQIIATLKRMFPKDFHIGHDYLKSLRSDRENESKPIGCRAASTEFMNAIRRLVHVAQSFVKSTCSMERIEDLALYDTCLAILFSVSTSLRINEIMQLTMDHLDSIRRNERVFIHSKGSVGHKTQRTIGMNNLLMAIINVVKSQRQKALAAVQTSHQTNHSPLFKSIRVREKQVIFSSVTFMYKKLKELAATNSIQLPRNEGISSLGFNSFRKYTTTLLVNDGAHMLAKTLNNHSGLGTTLRNYNVMHTEGAERALDLIKELAASKNK